MHHILQNKRQTKSINDFTSFWGVGWLPELNYVLVYCFSWGRLLERQHVFTNLIHVILVLELLYNRPFVKASQSKHKKIFQAITTQCRNVVSLRAACRLCKALYRLNQLKPAFQKADHILMRPTWPPCHRRLFRWLIQLDRLNCLQWQPLYSNLKFKIKPWNI